MISVAAAIVAITGFDLGSLISLANGAPLAGAATPTPAEPTSGRTQTAVTVFPSPTGSPTQPVAKWVIHLSPLGSNAPDLASSLKQAIQSALPGAEVNPASVSIESASLRPEVAKISDLNLVQDANGANLLIIWQSGDNGLIDVYLIDVAQPAPLSLDDPLQAWGVRAPGDVPVVISSKDDTVLPAGLAVGILQLVQGAADRALGQFQSLQTVSSGLPPEQQASNQAIILLMQGQAQEAQGATTDALESFSQALRLQGDFQAAALDRANVYQQMGDSKTALSVYQAMQSNPFYQRAALYNLILADQNTGDSDSALKSADDLIEAMPDSATALNLRGIIQYRRGDYAGALSDFIEASGLLPDSRPLLLNQAAAYLASNQADRAIETYDLLLKLSPNDPALYLKEGQAYLSAGNSDKAEAAFDQAIALDNQNAEAYTERARLEFKQNRLNQAITDAKQALTINPDGGEASRIVADSLLAQEDFAGAEQYYSDAIDHGVGDANVYAGRAWARHRQREISAAIHDYEQALALGLKDPAVLMRLGFAYYDAGLEDKSLDAFQQALAAELNTAEAHAGLAIALDANVQRKAAEAEYKKALALDNHFADRDFLKKQPLWSPGAISRAMSIVNRLK